MADDQQDDPSYDDSDGSDDGISSFTPSDAQGIAGSLTSNLASGGLTGEAQAATGLITALGTAAGPPPSATSGNAASTSGAVTSNPIFGQVTINSGAGASLTPTSSQGGISTTDILLAAGVGLVLFFIFRK